VEVKKLQTLGDFTEHDKLSLMSFKDALMHIMKSFFWPSVCAFNACSNLPKFYAIVGERERERL
jgi:hypothetical protein